MTKQSQKQCINLPKYVHHSKGRYIFRPYNPKTQTKGKEIVLCDDTAPMSVVWALYEQATSIDIRRGKPLRWGIQNYLNSYDFKNLSSLSQRDYQTYAKKIIRTPHDSGQLFGDLELEKITTGTLQHYLDQRSKVSPVAGNKEIGFLSVVYNWNIRRDYAEHNPASAVKKNPTKPRDRYVTNEEYEAALEIAKSGPHYLYPMMEIAYLCRARRGEILTTLKENITEEGFLLIRTKGSKTQIIKMSPRLKKVIDACNAIEPMHSIWLIHNEHGEKIKHEAFKSAWARMMKKLNAQGFKSFAFHDLKAKGVSDFKGDKLKASGHKTQSMLNVYDRKIEIVETTE